MPPEAWMSRPYEQWPVITLTNRARFRGHPATSWDQGGMASGFLIETIDGRVLAATAKHLLSSQWGGVNPTLQPSELDQAVESWTMYPRGRPDMAVELGKLAVPATSLGATEDESLDWVFMTLKTPRESLPAIQPLKIRDTAVQPNERIFVLAIPP
jgi:hypothetical protein